MNQKIAFIETISPKGHVNLNSFLFKACSREKKIIMGSSLKKYYSEFDCEFFDDSKLKSNRFFHLFISLYFTMYYLIKLKKMGFKKIVILSYDKYNIYIINILSIMLGVRVYAFEHNTFPLKESTLASIVFFKSKKIQRLCFLPHMVKKCIDKNIEATLIEHPIIINGSSNDASNDASNLKKLKNKAKNFKKIVFCPSGSNDKKMLEEKILKYPDFLFVIKHSECLKHFDNVLCIKFFYDLKTWMSLCDYIYIPVKFENRVSGFVYESIGFNKKIIIEKCLFSDYLIHRFPDYCLLADENWNNFNGNIQQPLNVKNYNDNLTKVLNSL